MKNNEKSQNNIKIKIKIYINIFFLFTLRFAWHVLVGRAQGSTRALMHIILAQLV